MEWKTMSHTSYSWDIASFGYHLFHSTGGVFFHGQVSFGSGALKVYQKYGKSIIENEGEYRPD